MLDEIFPTAAVPTLRVIRRAGKKSFNLSIERHIAFCEARRSPYRQKFEAQIGRLSEHMMHALQDKRISVDTDLRMTLLDLLQGVHYSAIITETAINNKRDADPLFVLHPRRQSIVYDYTETWVIINRLIIPCNHQLQPVIPFLDGDLPVNLDIKNIDGFKNGKGKKVKLALRKAKKALKPTVSPVSSQNILISPRSKSNSPCQRRAPRGRVGLYCGRMAP